MGRASSFQGGEAAACQDRLGSAFLYVLVLLVQLCQSGKVSLSRSAKSDTQIDAEISFANAYVSGMRQDLGFVGNEYSIVNTVFTVGYIIGQCVRVGFAKFARLSPNSLF